MGNGRVVLCDGSSSGTMSVGFEGLEEGELGDAMITRARGLEGKAK